MKSKSPWTRGFSAERDYTTRSRCRPARALEGVHCLRTEAHTKADWSRRGLTSHFRLQCNVLKGPRDLYIIKENWVCTRSAICPKMNVPCSPSRRPGWAERPDPHLAAKTGARGVWDWRHRDREVGERPKARGKRERLGWKVWFWE